MKMTDEQIIKAVNVCGSTPYTCKGCPYRKLGESGCIYKMLKDVYNLINRQAAEIIRLKGFVVTNNIMEIVRIKKQAKSNAIKEFAKRLKKDLGFGHFIRAEDIDNLVTEMTEEKACQNR